MPPYTVVEMGQEMAVPAVSPVDEKPTSPTDNALLDDKPIHDPVTGQFLKGWRGGPGRPKGSARARAILDHSAPSLMKHSIHRATVGKRDAVLNKLLDKIVPDATPAMGDSASLTVVFPTGMHAATWTTRNPLREPPALEA